MHAHLCRVFHVLALGYATEKSVFTTDVHWTLQDLNDRLARAAITEGHATSFRTFETVLVLDEACLTEGVDLEARLLGRLISDRKHVQIVLLQEETATHILPHARIVLLYDQLGHVEENFGAELIETEKLDDGLRVASIFPVYQYA